MIRKLLIVLVTTGAVVAVPSVAQARPGDQTGNPLSDYTSRADLGPGPHPDWWCTYQQTVQDIACTYQPGVHRSQIHLHQPRHWWAPWTW